MNFKQAMILVFFVALAGIAYQSVYKVGIDNVAVITQFGKIVSEPKKPGLHVKLPFQKVHEYSMHRMYRNETDAFSVKTKDHKFITVSTLAMWKIQDPNLFYKTVYSTEKAIPRLDDILFISIRKAIASHTLDDILNNHLQKEEEGLFLDREIHKNILMLCQSRLEKFGIQLDRIGVHIVELAFS